MSQKTILNYNDHPFRDLDSANQIASILSRETGRAYNVAEYDQGYAILCDQPNREIYLRPALRSQLKKLTLLVLAFITYLFATPLYTMLSIDHLVVELNRVMGQVWLTHESALYWIETGLFYGMLLIASMVFYAIYSRLYFIGPKGVEATVGIISKDQFRVEYSQVRGINLKQNIIERLLQYGSIEVSTSGSDGSEINFMNIADPGDVLAELRNRERDVK